MLETTSSAYAVTVYDGHMIVFPQNSGEPTLDGVLPV